MLNQVNIFEFAVIYLAIGAPLGVYHLTTHWGGSLVSTFSFAAVNICLWPAAALVYLYGHLNGKLRPFGSTPVSFHSEALVDAAGSILATDELFVFRETVARYVGVCQALEEPVGTSATQELLAISGIREWSTTEACTIRRNRAKLCLQQADARAGFCSRVKRLSLVDPILPKLAYDLAVALHDHLGADELKALQRSNLGNIHVSSDRISIAA